MGGGGFPMGGLSFSYTTIGPGGQRIHFSSNGGGRRQNFE
jgi:hypothetical protein